MDLKLRGGEDAFEGAVELKSEDESAPGTAYGELASSLGHSCLTAVKMLGMQKLGQPQLQVLAGGKE